MTTFRYPKMEVWVAARGQEKETFAKAVPDHFQWLENNDINYTISAFIWPKLPMAAQALLDVIEFDVIIEDVVQAVMFRLYTGIIPMDGDLTWSEN